MNFIANLLLVVGFCVGTLGAAGFQVPAKDREYLEYRELPVEERADTELEAPPPNFVARSTEDHAWWLFAGGFVVMTAGAALRRSLRGAPALAGEPEHEGRAQHLARIETARDALILLDGERESLDGLALRGRLEGILEGELFEVTSRYEDTLATLGFTDYAATWEGVANAERLLNRAWSMATDEHLAEARAEVPLARANLERAVAALS